MNQATVNSELATMDQWSGKYHSLVGIFLPIYTPNYQAFVTDVLDTSRENGYTPRNLSANITAYAISTGALDNPCAARLRLSVTMLAEENERPSSHAYRK